mgnify:CR=1 FL=1
MKIEEEIKQERFKDEYQKLIINQLFTGKWIASIIAKHLKQFGLSTQQYNVLRILRGQKSNAISVNEIADRMIDKMSNVSRLIDKLTQKELVRRKINFEDRRQVDIEITDKGLKLVNQVEQEESKLNQNFTNLNQEEAKQLNALLDKFRG